MDTKKKVKKSLPYSIAISLLNLVISLFGMVYLVRYLNETDFGMLGLFMGLPFFVNITTSMGYDLYIIRFAPVINETKKVARIFWRVISIQALLVIVASILLVIAFPYFGPKFKMEAHQAHFNMFQISLISIYASIYVRVLLNARFLQKQILFMRILYQAIRLGIIAWGIIGQKDFLFFIAGFAAMDAINLVVGLFVVSAQVGGPKLSYILKPFDESKDEREYRLISFVNKIGTSFLGTDIDRYILGYFSTTTQVAIYVLTTQILGKLGNFFPQSMFKPLATPAFFSEYDNSKEDNEKLNKMFQFIFNANNIVGFLFITCFMPVGRELLDFFFEKSYTQEAFWPVVIFMGFMVLYSMPIGMVTQAVKKPHILLISKVSIILNLALGIPLAKYYGATGMAAATALSYFIKNFIIYFMVQKYVDVSIPWLSFVYSIFNSGFTILIMYFITPYIHIHVLIDASIAGILYFVFMKMNPVFTPDQKKSLLKLVPKKASRIAELIF